MASINDLATAATLASSVARSQSPSTRSTSQAALSPSSPSPSAQLEAQAQEAHAQEIKSAGTSPAREPEQESEPQSEGPVAEPEPVEEPTPAELAAEIGTTEADPTSESEPTHSIHSDAADTTVPPVVESVNRPVDGGVNVPESSTTTPTKKTSVPVLAAPRISPGDPAKATIPPRRSLESGSEAVPASTHPDQHDAMEGVEYENWPREPRVRGAFLVFEGLDRAGKTTQAKLLQLRCIESGREVKFMRFPDRTTPIGQMIDSYLKGQADIEDHVIHLLFSANRWEAAQKIKNELEAGRTVICDRFYHSGIVYSAAKQLPSLSLSWAKAPEVGLPRPDMVLFLDLEESVARSRGGWGGEVYEKGEMQRRVRELFWGLSMGDLGNAVSSKSNGKGPSSSRSKSGNTPNSVSNADEEEGEFKQEEADIQIVDADTGVEELSDKVWELVLPRLQAVERGEEGKTVRIVR
ncbi:thymidylate kinase-domain-containing protein [Poronia punctata]|nr:thymidylate kinase-domain-containing protein [Poronia punctata]